LCDILYNWHRYFANLCYILAHSVMCLHDCNQSQFGSLDRNESSFNESSFQHVQT
jgi:hypothetical protein